MLRVKEEPALRWKVIEQRPNGTGRVTVGEGNAAVARVLSADTMRLLDAIRSNAKDDDRVLGLTPNQITSRIGAAAKQAGLGPGYGGESPRLGMLKDLDEMGAVLLGEQLHDEVPGSS